VELDGVAIIVGQLQRVTSALPGEVAAGQDPIEDAGAHLASEARTVVERAAKV
jgi:hypothetical protein